MATKPIIDVRSCGKRITVEFTREHKGICMKYDIIVDGKPIKVGAFAEEVMRWLGSALESKR